MKNIKRKKALSLCSYTLLAVGLLLIGLASRFPALIENGYSMSLYRWVSGPLSRLTGIYPFSVTEALVVAAVLFFLYKGVRGAIAAFRAPKNAFRILLQGLARLAFTLVLVFIGFNMLWGLNYNRLPFAEIAGLAVEPYTTADLRALAQSLADRANALRSEVREDGKGIMALSTGIGQMLARAEAGFDKAKGSYPELGGTYGRPKRVLLSRYWSYTGVCGMYFPFTAEANVNTHIPALLLPATTTHEMVHQRGFAREDETNYLAYLVCSLHPDGDFQYSGVVSALIHTMNALYRVDKDAWRSVRRGYQEGLNRDLENWREYWAGFEGPVERVSTNINDSYLKANRQQDGVQSYGRMVDLLLAEFKQKEEGQP